MIRGIAFLFVMLNFSSYGQIQLMYIQEQSPVNARVETSEDTLELPFWDDFSASRIVPDTSLWLYGRDVFINNSLPILPPSLYVATFDGINELGNPHNSSSTFGGAGDSLVTHAINLDLVPETRRQSVYLSFYWQLLGNGEIPEADDSLALYFLDSAGQWISQDLVPDESDQNALVGGRDNINLDPDSIQEFQMIMLPVVGGQFFHPGFKMKFVSYSSLSGVYDTWHVDYIYLNQDREASRTTFFDRTLSLQPSLLFAPYHEITVEQYLADPTRYERPQLSHANNLDNSFHPLIYDHRIVNLVNDAEIDSNDIIRFSMEPREIGRPIEGLAMDPGIISGDSNVIMSEFVYNTGDRNLFEVIGSDGDTLFLDVDLRTNDTVRQYYTLFEHMAYDDGVADYAAGINILQGLLAVQYVVNTPDTLTGVRINFPAISPSSQGQTVNILIWFDLDDRGTQLASHEITNTSRTEFNEITFGTPIFVSDTFYIGFQQFTDNYIGVGFDKDNPLGTEYIYSNTDLEWQKNERVIGSLMIRPVFSKSDFILSVENPTESVNIYPNPSDGQIYFSKEVEMVQVLSLSGKELFRDRDANSMNLSHLPRGIYLCILTTKRSQFTHRIIID